MTSDVDGHARPIPVLYSTMGEGNFTPTAKDGTAYLEAVKRGLNPRNQDDTPAESEAVGETSDR